MQRRTLITAGAGALGLAAAPGLARAAGVPLTPESVADAWLAGVAPVEMAAARARMLSPHAVGQTAGLNAFHHTRLPVRAGDRAITTPNNDTLYSNAFIDLTRGPVTLSVPDAGRRYLSVAVMDMYTNNNVVLGARTAGGAAGRFVLVGPGQRAPAGARALQAATPHAWVLARTLVDGPQDLEAAHRVQDALVLKGPAVGPYPAYATRADDARAYFASVERLLASDPPPTRAGLGALPLPPGADLRVVEEGAARGRAVVAAGRASLRFQDGWQYPMPRLGDYGDEFRYRALVAVGGLGALVPAEAMYMKAAGDTGKGLFNGDGPFRLSLPGALPVNSFWSLTMYEATPDGQFFLTENALDRFAIGDRTRGLKFGPNGALDLWLGRSDPGGARTSNWLPAPRQGPWAVTLRAYLPKPDLLEGRYRLPPITPA